MAILLLSNVTSTVAQQSEEFFPLSAGNYWIFKGSVKWGDSEGQSKNITWKMEVIDRVKNGPYEIAVMKGHPGDLCWYEPGRKPSRYLIVWKDSKYYEVSIHNDFDKLVNDEAYLFSKTNFNSLFLVDPLKKNLEFGNDPDIHRDDTFYEWLVEDEERGSLSGIGGIPRREKVQKYTLVYRTMPDHQIVEFVPSVGITKYIYQHHGTVSEVDVRLTEFRKK